MFSVHFATFARLCFILFLTCMDAYCGTSLYTICKCLSTSSCVNSGDFLDILMCCKYGVYMFIILSLSVSVNLFLTVYTSSVPLVRTIFFESFHCAFTHIGYNVLYGRQRYRDGVCSPLFPLFFIICHPYIPLHFEEVIFILDSHNFWCMYTGSKKCAIDCTRKCR